MPPPDTDGNGAKELPMMREYTLAETPDLRIIAAALFGEENLKTDGLGRLLPQPRRPGTGR
jgi:hypothetical protein